MTMFGSQWLASVGGDYEIDQSIRFNFSDSPSLLRTPGSASNRRTWTWSAWVKRCGLGNPGGPNSVHQLFGVGAGSCLRFTPDDNLRLESPGGQHTFITSQVFRDTSAWYHVVLAFDSTQSTDTNRRKLYINGSQVTSFSSTTFTELGQNAEWDINSTSEHQIGKSNLADFFGGYMAEIQLIDGSALAPTAFGETNDDGVRVPIKYSGSYGTNGYFIDGRDSSDLGDDESGNGNDYASSGFTAADQMSDSPTLNYPLININDAQLPGNVTLTDGNLTYKNANSGTAADARATFAVSSGKWYWEVEADTLGQSGVNREFIGIVGVEFDITSGSAGASFSADSSGFAFATTGQKINGGTAASYGSAFSAGQYIGVALDLDNGKIYWSINGTFQNSGDPAGGSGEAYSSISGTFAPAFAVDYGTGNSTLIANFGQSSFQNSPPTGFKALNSANLPEPAIKDGSSAFHTQLYTGDGSSGLSITNDANAGDFKPDIWWVSPRSRDDNKVFIDIARGVTKRIKANGADPEDTDSPAQVTFETDGFDLDTTDVNFNSSGDTYVAWQWKTQGGAGSSNTDGSTNTITTSVNQTNGISINTYTGTGSNATVGHGLGAVPKMIIIKDRTNTESWIVYHEAVGNDGNVYLNLTNGKATQAVFQNTTPTSSVFSLGTTDGANKASGLHVAYCFAEVTGFSRFGKYIGNGSTDGPFVHCGFRPAWFLLKPFSTDDNWELRDSARDPSNVTDKLLDPNLSNGEFTGGAAMDFVSNGVKLRSSSSGHNGDGVSFLFAAFAENPFGGSGVAPVTAR